MGTAFIQLSDWERTKIMVMRAQTCSVRAIARTLHRSPSTIGRELRRNGFHDSYSAALAGKRAAARKHVRPRLVWHNLRLHSYIVGRLKQGWSPQAIAGRLASMLGKESEYCVSHETIYASIYALPRGELLNRAHQGTAPVTQNPQTAHAWAR